MFTPKQTKFKKQHKGRKFNKIKKPVTVLEVLNNSDVVVLRSLGHSRISDRQLFTIRQTIAKKIKKQGKFYINLFADTPVSKKPLEIRMGKGKGAVNSWIAKLVPGFIIVELHGVVSTKAIAVLEEVQKKLPIKTVIDFSNK